MAPDSSGKAFDLQRVINRAILRGHEVRVIDPKSKDEMAEVLASLPGRTHLDRLAREARKPDLAIARVTGQTR